MYRVNSIDKKGPRMKQLNLIFLGLFTCMIASLNGLSFVLAEDLDNKLLEPGQKQEKKRPHPKIILEGTMTIEKMGQIIKRLDKTSNSPRKGMWSFTVENRPVVIVTDVSNNRMRIMVPIRKVEGLSIEEYKRVMQANFDTALDSRYAIAKNIVWATYIHSLSTLHKRQFISAIGQTVNCAITYGSTYSSGLLAFQGGDSKGILRRQLIDKLLDKGIPI